MRLDFCQAPEEMVSVLVEIRQMQEWVSENIQVLSETFTFTCFDWPNVSNNTAKKLLKERGLLKVQNALVLYPMSLPGPPGTKDNFDEKPGFKHRLTRQDQKGF